MLDGAQAERLHRLLRRLIPQGWGHHRSGLFKWGFSPCEGYGSICGDAGLWRIPSAGLARLVRSAIIPAAATRSTPTYLLACCEWPAGYVKSPNGAAYEDCDSAYNYVGCDEPGETFSGKDTASWSCVPGESEPSDQLCELASAAEIRSTVR